MGTANSNPIIELTGFTKEDGPLTKRISLSDSGALITDGSACIMSRSRATRLKFGDLNSLAAHIESLDPAQAIALDSLDHAISAETVRVVPKVTLEKLNGSAAPDRIARTASYIHYVAGQPALVLIDFDAKGMPTPVRKRIQASGGIRPALTSVLPELCNVGQVVRRSTSGILNADTGQRFAGSAGAHLYVLTADGNDAERFLRTLHDRCWLAGLGWMIVGKAGQLLERSLVDRTVYAPERLVFEGGPVVAPPLIQDKASRKPVATDGPPLDTLSACPPLRIVEQATLNELHAKETHRLGHDSAKARKAFVAEQSQRIVQRTVVTLDAARRTVERQCDGILLPDVVLPFDLEEFESCTVADVIADSDRFVGATLADPLEGIDYGCSKAKIMQRADCSLWVHSFAHGRTIYELKIDAPTHRAETCERGRCRCRQRIRKDGGGQRHRPGATGEDQGRTRRTLQRVTKRGIDKTVSDAIAEHAAKRRQEEHARKLAMRTDPRPQLIAPLPDARLLPCMSGLNDVLGASKAIEPPASDVDGVVTQVRIRRVPNMYALTPDGANQAEPTNSRLPASEQALLTRLNEAQPGELIERHIDYIDAAGRSVHLASPFVHHYHVRPDGDALPLVAFLTDEWLCDVATDYPGKCSLISAALTVIERSLLSDRPTFWVTAGRRGGGKTTTLMMLLMRVTGVRPSAAAWSPNAEERRKALLSYLLSAAPAVIGDNIARGTQIACPHIEASCTTAFYSDRRLGASEMVSVAASLIHFFTGNNVGPRGDLTSRSLKVRLETETADPENRPFTHPDPIGGTKANRGKSSKCLYTIMLGNPALRPGSNAVPETRFKTWWKLIVSAVEHAAGLCAAQTRDDVSWMTSPTRPSSCPAEGVRFRDLFLAQEEDDEDDPSLGEVLAGLAAKEWTGAQLKAADLVKLMSDHQSEWVKGDDRELGPPRLPVSRRHGWPDRLRQVSGPAAETAYRRAGQGRQTDIDPEGIPGPRPPRIGRGTLSLSGRTPASDPCGVGGVCFRRRQPARLDSQAIVTVSPSPDYALASACSP